MKIALDLDGVLADLMGQVVAQSRYTDDDTMQYGEWDDFDHFRTTVETIWDDRTETIEPVDDDIDQVTAALAEDHTVDVVTHTFGSLDSVAWWLDEHDVSYRNLVHPYRQDIADGKSNLDYDAFIDDKPAMAGNVSVQYIRDQPWNQTVRGHGEYLYYSYEDCYTDSEGPLKVDPFRSDVPWVIRITGLSDVVADLEYQVPLDR